MNWLGKSQFYYAGYYTVDSLYNNSIRPYLEYYTIENNIPETYFEDEDEIVEDIVVEETAPEEIVVEETKG